MSKNTVKFIKLSNEAAKEIKLPKQANEILAWAYPEYGDTVVDQKELFEAMDSHLTDNKILSVTPKQPISRIFQFYRKRLAEEGLIEITKEAGEPKAPKEKKEGEPKASKSRRRKDEPVDEETADVL